MGQIPNPGKNEQHLIIVDAIKSYTGPKISPFLNRYLLRSIHMDVIRSQKTALTYTKMGHFILLGFIQMNHANRWKGTKLHVNNGTLSPGHFSIPENIMEYINYKANESAKALATISPKQNELIQKAVVSDPDRTAKSEIFKAMQCDVFHSGKEAFIVTNAEDSEEILSDD